MCMCTFPLPVTEQKKEVRLLVYHKSQTYEADTGAKGGGFYSGAAGSRSLADAVSNPIFVVGFILSQTYL